MTKLFCFIWALFPGIIIDSGWYFHSIPAGASHTEFVAKTTSVSYLEGTCGLGIQVASATHFSAFAQHYIKLKRMARP